MGEAYLVVNYIRVEENKIIIGATDNERYQWDIDDGESGADAKTIIMVTLEIDDDGYTAEKAELFCDRSDGLRLLVIEKIENLFTIAWDIYDKKLDKKHARDNYFAYEIR